MTDALFLSDLHDPRVGDQVRLAGEEGRHAAVVRRIQLGETILVSDGAGTAVRGPVVAADKTGVTLEVAEVLRSPVEAVRYVAVQALPKGDRAERAVEVLTELGIDEIVPWQASRSIVKWVPDRAERHLARWRSTAREATKQSRRFRVPVVTVPLSTREVALRIPDTALTLVLHEEADTPLATLDVPASGDVMLIVGPEGGISPEELEAFTRAGAQVASLGDGVLRTSTAGVVALAQLQALAHRRSRDAG